MMDFTVRTRKASRSGRTARQVGDSREGDRLGPGVRRATARAGPGGPGAPEGDCPASLGKGSGAEFHLPTVWFLARLGPANRRRFTCRILRAARAARRTGRLLPSFVVSDPKAELLALAVPELATAGHEVRVFAPGVPSLSGGYDLLSWLRRSGGVDYAEVLAAVEAIMPASGKEGDPYWIHAAQILLADARVVAAKNEKATFGHALGLLYAAAEHSLARAQVDPWAASQLHALLEDLAKNLKVLGTIRSEIPARLGLWSTPAMLGIFSAADWSWERVFDRPAAVFVVARREHSAIQAALWSHLFATIRRQPGRLPRPLVLLMDEFGNIGKIPSLEEAINVRRFEEGRRCGGDPGPG